MQELMRVVTRARELKYVQIIYLLSATDWTAEEISKIVGTETMMVNRVLTQYAKDGEQALLREDHGYIRRHARLTLSQEKEVIGVCERDVDASAITSRYVVETVQRQFSVAITTTNACDLLVRHGWEADRTGRGAQWFPTKQAGYYSPKSQRRDWHRERGNENMHLLTTRAETRVLDRLKRKYERGEAVTRVVAQAALSQASVRPISRQTTIRTLRRHKWQLEQFGGDSVWHPPGVTRMMTPEAEEHVFAELAHQDSVGASIKLGDVRAALSNKTGRSVSRQAAMARLRRHNWELVGKRASDYRWRPMERGGKSKTPE